MANLQGHARTLASRRSPDRPYPGTDMLRSDASERAASARSNPPVPDGQASLPSGALEIGRALLEEGLHALALVGAREQELERLALEHEPGIEARVLSGVGSPP